MNSNLAIGVNFFIAFLIPIILYFFILKPGKSPVSEFILVPGVSFGVMFVLAFTTSLIASKEECDSFNWTTGLLNGLKTPFAVCITYAIIFLFPGFTFPFMRITGSYANEPVVSYIAQAILLAFSTLPATASVWLSSQKYGCALSSTQISEMNRQNAQELNKSPPNPNYQTQQVTV
jgi:hypothetical protein